jgi:hypothetical protein
MNIESLLANYDIRWLSQSRLADILGPEYTLNMAFGDWGGRLYVKGPNVPFLFNGFAADGDDFSPSFDALRKLMRLGIIEPSTVVANLYK